MSYQPLAQEGQQQQGVVPTAYAQPTASAPATAPQPTYGSNGQPTYAQPAYAQPPGNYAGGYQSGPLPAPVPQTQAYTANGQPVTYAPGAVFNPNQQQQQVAPVLVVAPVHMTMNPSLQLPHAPCRVVCQHCNGNVVTRTDKITGVGNWLGCAGCCLVGCWLGCFLIPFGIDGLKDTQHSCPQCGKAIALTQQVRF